MKQFLILTISFLISLISTSQSTELELDPVTVSATLNPSPSSRTGRNITSIPGNYFDKLPVHSIDELLRYIPGIEVQMRGPAGSQSDIALRGGTFQQVLIILDGLRLNDPNTGHFNSYIPIAPTEIERIEVLKGASSAIYGTEAVGGVINIITKTFAAKSKQDRKQFQLSATGGEYELCNASVGTYIQCDNTAISAGILSNNSSGQPQRGTRGAFHNTTASLSFKQFIGDHFSISARSSYDQRRFGAQNFYTTFVSDTAKEEVSSNWNQLNLHFQQGKHEADLNTGYKFVKDIYKYNPGSTANNNKSNLFQVQFADHYKLSAKTVFTTGFQYQDRKIRSNDRGNHNLSQFAGFFILNQKLGEFAFSPSIRIDYNEIRGTELVPQVNLSYHLNKFQLRASAGKTIREADFTERYNNYNKTLVTGGSIGNPDLEAERSFSYEAGADYFASHNLKIAISGFQRRQSQLIDWVPTPYMQMPRKSNLSPTGTYALAMNIAKVKTTGIETDLQYNKNHFFSTLGLLYLESKSSNAIPSFYIASHARFLANLSTEIRVKSFSFAVTSIYKNRKPQKATSINAEVDENCFMINAKASLFFFKQKLSAFGQVDNITDSKCADLLGPRTPGRWIMGGINVSL